MNRNKLAHALGVITFSSLLGACAPVNTKDTTSNWGDPDELVKAPSIPQQGFIYTRTVGDDWKPNKPWTGSVITDGDLYVMDFGLELSQQANGNYYRVHIYPQHNVPLSQLNPWIEVTVNRDHDDKNPMILFAKLPDDRSSDKTPTLTTNWFICDACTRGQTEFFKTLTNAESKSTDTNYYRFSKRSQPTPNWQGDMLAREAEFEAAAEAKQAKQRQLLALEKSLPPEVRRDKYMVQLSSLLKQQNYQAALDIFPKLEALPIPTDPSLKFFYGEALLKTGKPAKALPKLYEYINEQGSGATNYARALKLINEAESKL